MGWLDLERMMDRFGDDRRRDGDYDRHGYGERHEGREREAYNEGYEEGCEEGYRKAMEHMERGGYGERRGDGGTYYPDGDGYGERRGVKGTGRYSRSRR